MSTNYVQKGEVVEVLESLLTHPTHTDGFVDSGDPVVKGVLKGVALEGAAAATDTVSVALNGVFDLSVAATNSGGNSAVAVGDQVYISSSTAALSKNTGGVAFGIALEAITSGETATINVLL